VLGVIFDTDPAHAEGLEQWEIDYIDAFFDSLSWDVTDRNPMVSEIQFAKFLSMADTDRRWTYEGSLTTPPCSNSV